MATMPLPTVCPSCGAVFTRDDGRAAACPECQPNRHRPGPDDRLRGSATSRGYGKAWQRLSRRARRLQPYCTDCGSPDDLTADHSPEAWQAHEDGRPITLDMIDVVCRRCNGSRGAARGTAALDRPTIGDQRNALDRAHRLVVETQGGEGSTVAAGTHGGRSNVRLTTQKVPK